MKGMSAGTEFLNDIKFNVTHGLYKKGCDVSTAESIAEAVKGNIHLQFQRLNFYLPNLKCMGGEEVNQRVISLFQEGKKPFEISRLVGLGSDRIYKILRSRNKSEKKPNKQPASMKDLLAIKLIAAKTLLQHGIEGQLSKEVSDGLEMFLLKNWGGNVLSFPAAITLKISVDGGERIVTPGQRADLLFKDYTAGVPIKDLSEKYSLTKDQVKTILDRLKQQQTSEED